MFWLAAFLHPLRSICVESGRFGRHYRQDGAVAVLAAEELPDDVLGPPFGEFFIREGASVLEAEPSRHKPDGQARAACVADAIARNGHTGTEQVG